MIPTFPEFKPLELSDRAAVEAVVHSFPPYSDFNFTNLYVWDTHGAMRLSRLHGNLVVQFIDYVSETPFLTFIGRHRLAETATQLLELAKAQCRSAILRLVPESVAHLLADTGFVVTADDAAKDYVYAVDHIANMDGWVGRSARRRIRQFSARHPNYAVRHAPLHAIDTEEFRALFALWAEHKGSASPHFSNEYHAFERFLRLKDTNIETVGLYADARLVGFSSFELLPGGTAIVHFSKTDNAFHRGICDVLYWEEARLLKTRGVSAYSGRW
ncbi:MAG: GNAT family N-acetyltransferase [Sulfuritalea sp.]|nr:GNAT family N-acetyltransferase [Sulfuritalea sp.]